MFVGHYTASFIAKGLEPRASLGLLFIAAQFLDLIFFPLVLLHSESLTMLANATASTHFELPYMPFSHSIWASIFWACAVFIISLRILDLSKTVSLLLALVVLSHWVLDLLVHTPDLAVWNIFNQDAVKWGFGLWNSAVLAYILEFSVLTIAVIFYMRRTHAVSPKGRYLIPLYLASLLALQALLTFGPHVELQKSAFAWLAIASFLVLAIVSGFLDLYRKGGQHNESQG